MKSASSFKRVSTRGKKMHRAMVRKQSERDQRMQRIHEDLELAIEDDIVDEDMVRKQIYEDPELAIKDEDVVVMGTRPEKARKPSTSTLPEKARPPTSMLPEKARPSSMSMLPEPSGLQQHVTKAGHVPCKECEKEKARGDGLGFHFCPNDEVIIGFMTKAGSIGSPSARSFGPDPVAVGRTPRARWYWRGNDASVLI